MTASVGVLDKVVAILDAFQDGDTKLAPPEAAALLGLSEATTYRLMRALRDHGLLQSDGSHYRLGLKLLGLAQRVLSGSGLVAVAIPHMKSLRDATEATVELHVLGGYSRVPIEMVIGRGPLRAMSELGVPLPLHLGASGRVLLMDADEEVAMTKARASAEQDANMPWDERRYRAKLRQVREQGWDFSTGERDLEIASVAAPIHDRHGVVVAAIAVAAPATRFKEDAHRSLVIAQTRDCAAVISSALGHQGELTATKESIA